MIEELEPGADVENEQRPMNAKARWQWALTFLSGDNTSKDLLGGNTDDTRLTEYTGSRKMSDRTEGLLRLKSLRRNSNKLAFRRLSGNAISMAAAAMLTKSRRDFEVQDMLKKIDLLNDLTDMQIRYPCTLCFKDMCLVLFLLPPL